MVSVWLSGTIALIQLTTLVWISSALLTDPGIDFVKSHNAQLKRTAMRIITPKGSNRMPTISKARELVLFSSSSNKNESGDDSKNGKSPSDNKKRSSSPKSKKKAKKRTVKSKSSPATNKSSSGGSGGDSNRRKLQAKDKEEIMSKLKARLEEKKRLESEGKKDGGRGGSGGNILDKLNPFQAGQNLRKTIGTLSTLGAGLSDETKQKYYLDDRLRRKGGGGGSGGGSSSGGAALFSERNPYLERLERDDFVPEVLVIGATGAVGRLVVRRLLLDGRFRVRVLVRDLYSKTLNLLGTGVTYCRGDLGNMESLEYAVTDVDKIVFCAAAPRPDEADFQEKFQYFVQENLESGDDDDGSGTGTNDKNKNIIQVTKQEEEGIANDMEWEQLDSVLQVRAQLAEQVDFVGMQNLIRAYQNVRHADYGTSQAAKRSLFKFKSRPEDFSLFTIDEGGDATSDDSREDPEVEDIEVDESLTGVKSTSGDTGADYYYDEIPDEDLYDEYFDDDDFDDSEYTGLEKRKDATVKTQCLWLRNDFGYGVFVGKVPKATSASGGGESSIISSRLRSRGEPENGIDLSEGFGGFIVRLCGDGSNYEAFVRTAAYEEDGIEYVCEFSTATKPTRRGNKSRNKFTTVRLPFRNFKPVLRKGDDEGDEVDDMDVEPFDGSDVRFMGFRYRSASNEEQSKRWEGDKNSFYLAMSFIKVYRSQPEPEFVYLSDARIPRVVKDGMVRHDRRMLLTGGADESKDGNAVQILDEAALRSSVDTLARSGEETYYKLRGEEILKNSGLR